MRRGMPFQRLPAAGAVLVHLVLVGLWCSPCASHVKKHAHLTSLAVVGSQGNVSLSPPFHPKGLVYDAGWVPGGFLELYMDLPSWVPVSLPAALTFVNLFAVSSLVRLSFTPQAWSLDPLPAHIMASCWRSENPGVPYKASFSSIVVICWVKFMPLSCSSPEFSVLSHSGICTQAYENVTITVNCTEECHGIPVAPHSTSSPLATAEVVTLFEDRPTNVLIWLEGEHYKHTTYTITATGTRNSGRDALQMHWLFSWHHWALCVCALGPVLSELCPCCCCCSFYPIHLAARKPAPPTPPPSKHYWTPLAIASVFVLILGSLAAVGYNRGWHTAVMRWVQEAHRREEFSELYEPLNTGPSQHYTS